MSHNPPTYGSVVVSKSATLGEDNAAIEIDAPFLDEVFSSTGGRSGECSNMSREKSDSFSTDDSSATSVSLRVQQLDSTDSGLPEKPLFSLPRLRRRVRGACTLKLLKRRLPFLEWIPRCTVQSVIYDALAGFTVALTSIPQSIAYAAVAGIPLEYGLYTAFTGPFAYVLFGSVFQITMAPTAVMALMANPYVQKGGIEYAIILSFLSGCIELLAGLLNLGFLMDFISGPVISGFVSAAATTVIFSQLKTICGLKFPGSTVDRVLPGFFTHWKEIRLWDTLLGFGFIVFLVLLKNLTDLKKYFPKTCCLHRPMVNKVLWFISTCRNALAVIFGCVITYVLHLYDYAPFNVTGEIKSGIPTFKLPPFGFERPVDQIIPFNTTNNWTDSITNVTTEWVSFGDIMSDFGFGFVLVPVVAILEQVAIAKAFSNGGRTDSTQEMLAVGICSIFGSFFGCIPLTASFSRSSVLSASGGQTQLAGFFIGSVILMALAFLMPTLSFIPKSVLGAVLITSIYPLIEFHEFHLMWKGRKIELIPFLTTFFCCLFINMEYGILIGAQVHLLLLAYGATRSKSDCVRDKDMDETRVIVKVDRNLYFPSVERFRNALSKASTFKTDADRVIVIDLSRVTEVDHTSLKMLNAMLSSWDKKGEKYCFTKVDPKVRQSLLAVLPANVSFV